MYFIRLVAYIALGILAFEQCRIVLLMPLVSFVTFHRAADVMFLSNPLIEFPFTHKGDSFCLSVVLLCTMWIPCCSKPLNVQC